MPTFDPLGFDLPIDPSANLKAVEDALTGFQNKFNNLESDLKEAITPSNPPKPPSGLKVPGKIFDPVFGPNVIFGYVLTSDFMSFCDYKPLARVGDLVFVVGIVGITVVAEIGVVSSGCMDVRNNSFGSGAPYPGGPGTGGLAGGCDGQKASPLYDATINADFLDPALLDRIDPCLNSGNLANCLPEIVQDVMGLCDGAAPNLGYGAVNDFHLDSQLQKIGADHLAKLNQMLKNGFCGSPKVSVTFSDVPPGDICSPGKAIPSKPRNPNAPCVTEHMKYISNKINEKTGLSFGEDFGGFISKHDLQLISLTTDIKNYHQTQFINAINDLLNKFPKEYPSNGAEAINLALQVADDVFGLSKNNELSVASYRSIVNDMKALEKKIRAIAENPIYEITELIKNDPELNRFFGSLVDEMNDSLNSLKPPPPSGTSVCPDGPSIFDTRGSLLEGCKEIADLQKEVNSGISNILKAINGGDGKNGLIAQNMDKEGIGNIRKATGAAGMNPIDSLTLYRNEVMDKVSRCMQQTEKVKQYLQYCERTSYNVMGDWATFSSTFSASPRDPNTGNLLSTAGLTPILESIYQQCVTMPQQQIEQFALDSADMMSDIRNFNFVSMDPNLVGLNPPLAVMLADPSVLIPASNIGMILSSAQAAVQQALQNAQLIRQQLMTIIPSKEAMLAQMMAYADNVLKMCIDSLKSLYGCLPPLPCIDFKGLFDLDAALDLKIGNPLNIKLPVMDLAFPNMDFKLPIVFPTIVTPTGFNLALNVALPQIKFPRIPTPPLFPPNLSLPTIRLPQLRFPFDLSALNKLIPKFPNAAFEIPVPQIKIPRFAGIILPPIKVKLPKYAMRFGGFPFPKLNINLPKFPVQVSFHMPISFDIQVPIPSISLKLPSLPKFPLLNIPKITLNVPKLNIPFDGGLSFGSPTLGKIAIPFPAVTIPSLCGDDGKTVDELIADGKNTFNRIVNTGLSGGRPLAVANCSLWVSPHFRGWIAPIPCSAMATDFSKCMCLG